MTTLSDYVLQQLIGFTVHRIERLNNKAEKAQKAFIASLKLPRMHTPSQYPYVIAMVGLVGSGKSTVAREIALLTDAVIVEADQIRVELRKQGADYEYARIIAENVTILLVTRGYNVLLDSDFINDKKRASLCKKLQTVHAPIVYVRTSCDVDLSIGRTIKASYKATENDFFGGASSKWSDEDTKGAVVKIRELQRRTPLHYRWRKAGGGTWEMRKLTLFPLVEINTDDERRWKRELTKKLAHLFGR